MSFKPPNTHRTVAASLSPVFLPCRQPALCLVATLLLLLAFSIPETNATQSEGDVRDSSNLIQHWSHAAVVVGKKLYVHGGFHSASLNNPNMVETLEYLDLTSPFNTSIPPWHVISPVSGKDSRPPLLASHSAVRDSKDKRIVVYGGQSLYKENVTSIAYSVYIFNTFTHIWTNPTKTEAPPQRFGHSAICTDDNRQMVVFGGRMFEQNTTDYPFTKDAWAMNLSTDSGESIGTSLKVLNDPGTTDQGPLIWNEIANPNIDKISTRQYHTATLINSTHMVIIGGRTTQGLAPMDRILLYQIDKGIWKDIKTKGDAPKQRMSHTAAMTNDGILLIHGGTNFDYLESMGDLSALDTKSWTWKSMESDPNSPKVFGHTATFVDPYVVYTHGYTINLDSPKSSVAVFNTESGKFEDMYDSKKTAMDKSNEEARALRSGSVFSITITSVVGLIVMLLLSFVGYHRYKRKSQRFGSKNQHNSSSSALRRLNTLGSFRGKHTRDDSSIDSIEIIDEHDAYEEFDRKQGVSETGADIDRQLKENLNEASVPQTPDSSNSSRRVHLDNVSIPQKLRNKSLKDKASRRTKSKNQKASARSNSAKFNPNRITMPAPSEEMIRSLGLDQLDDDPSRGIPLETISEAYSEDIAGHSRQNSMASHDILYSTKPSKLEDRGMNGLDPIHADLVPESSSRKEVTTPDSLKDLPSKISGELSSNMKEKPIPNHPHFFVTNPDNQ